MIADAIGQVTQKVANANADAPLHATQGREVGVSIRAVLENGHAVLVAVEVTMTRTETGFVRRTERTAATKPTNPFLVEMFEKSTARRGGISAMTQ